MFSQQCNRHFVKQAQLFEVRLSKDLPLCFSATHHYYRTYSCRAGHKVDRGEQIVQQRVDNGQRESSGLARGQ